MRLLRSFLTYPDRPILLISFILLGLLFYTVARSDTSTHPKTDILGNVYPELCRQAYLTKPYFVWTVPLDDKWYGQYFAPGRYHPTHHVILVNAKMYRDKVTHEAIVQHERCHAIMWEYTGDAEWHPAQ